MKLDRDTELAMLELKVKPQIQKARECLQAGKADEIGKIIAHDIIGLLQPYGDSEQEKYDNIPDNLKEAPNTERMLKNAELYQEAIDLLCDKETNTLCPIDGGTLNAVENIIDEIMRS